MHDDPEFYSRQDFAFGRESKIYDVSELQEMRLHVTRLVRAWCRDLLHVPASMAIRHSLDDTELFRPGTIQFLHCTVYECLTTEEVQSII
jgi:hypothetical protein